MHPAFVVLVAELIEDDHQRTAPSGSSGACGRVAPAPALRPPRIGQPSTSRG